MLIEQCRETWKELDWEPDCDHGCCCIGRKDGDIVLRVSSRWDQFTITVVGDNNEMKAWGNTFGAAVRLLGSLRFPVAALPSAVE